MNEASLAAEGPSRPEGQVAPPLRVLLADDADILRAMMVRHLSEHGFAVVGEVTTGAAAVRQAQVLRPDVVVLDVSMPEMDGLEALLELRAACPEIKVVVFSAYEAAHMATTVVELGAEAYLEKSQGLSALSAAIRQAAAPAPLAFEAPAALDAA